MLVTIRRAAAAAAATALTTVIFASAAPPASAWEVFVNFEDGHTELKLTAGEVDSATNLNNAYNLCQDASDAAVAQGDGLPELVCGTFVRDCAVIANDYNRPIRVSFYWDRNVCTLTS